MKKLDVANPWIARQEATYGDRVYLMSLKKITRGFFRDRTDRY